MNVFKSVAVYALVSLVSMPVMHAQRGYIRQQIRKDIEKKTAEPQKDKGVKAIEDITYENDTRYKDYKNANPISLEFSTTTFDKKGAVKSTTHEKFVFGKVGECMVMNMGDKNENWMIYNYKDRANYMVNVKDKTAVKMPLVNAQKMVEKQMAKQDNEKIIWERTTETKTINGYACQKYICRYENGSYVEVWSTKSPVIQFPANYLLGMQMQKLGTLNKQNASVPTGTIVDMIFFDKAGKMQSQRTLQKVNKGAEDQYFDMSQFRINDVIDALR